jgi:hypothetical protein
MVINTRNKTYTNKSKVDSSRTTFAPSSSSQDANPQVDRSSNSQGVSTPFPPSKYNILNQLANIKADASLLDMVTVPEQQQHLKISWKVKLP